MLYMAWPVTKGIAAVTGIPVERIALNFIHTHSAPCAGGLAEMPIDTDYFAHVGDLCGELGLRAMERRVPGSFSSRRLAVPPSESPSGDALFSSSPASPPDANTPDLPT